MNRFLSKAVATSAAIGTAFQVAATTASVYAVDIAGTPVTAGKGFAVNIGTVINAVLSFVMVIGALMVLMYMVWGGIEWISSGGDKGKTESARNKITAAVIGLIILAASYAVFTLVIKFLGFTDAADLLNVTPINTGG